MSRTALQHHQLTEQQFTRGLAAQSAGVGQTLATRPDGLKQPSPYSAPHVARDPVDRFTEALVATTLAIANLSRSIRHEPLAAGAIDLHPAVIASCQAAAIEAGLSQQRAAVKEAIDETGDELFTLLTAVLDGEHDDAAMILDVDRRREVCRAWARSLLTTYRQGLGGQLSVLRSAASDEAAK